MYLAFFFREWGVSLRRTHKNERRNQKKEQQNSESEQQSHENEQRSHDNDRRSHEYERGSGENASRFLVVASHSPRGFATCSLVASLLQNHQLRRLRYTNHHDNLHMIEFKNVIVIIV